jgi:hypothetical protein
MAVNVGAIIRDVALLVDHEIREKMITPRLPDGGGPDHRGQTGWWVGQGPHEFSLKTIASRFG